MNWGMFITGLLLLIISVGDLLYTSFSARGAGFITSITTKAVWKLLVWLSRQVKSTMLKWAGFVIVCYSLLQWVVLVWFSSSLIALSHEQSFLNGKTKVPASFAEKIYVAGYSLATLGNGDFVGSTEAWKVYISILAFIGMVSITVILTYLLQVLTVVTTKRMVSSSITSLGSTPQQVLMNAWNGNDFSSLNLPLWQLGSQVTTLAEKHLAFPVLHYYYSPDRKKALPVAIAVLDEAMTLMYEHIPRKHWPDPLLLQSARESVGGFLNTLKSNFITESEEVPPVTDFTPLEQKGIPIQRKAGESENNKELEQRRKMLLALLKDEGRDWKQVYRS